MDSYKGDITMARKTIRNHTYANHMLVLNKLMTEKGYDFDTANDIARQLFNQLDANPGGNIWIWYDHIITAKRDAAIKRYNELWELYEKGMITRLEMQEQCASIKAEMYSR